MNVKCIWNWADTCKCLLWCSYRSIYTHFSGEGRSESLRSCPGVRLFVSACFVLRIDTHICVFVIQANYWDYSWDVNLGVCDVLQCCLKPEMVNVYLQFVLLLSKN